MTASIADVTELGMRRRQDRITQMLDAVAPPPIPQPPEPQRAAFVPAPWVLLTLAIVAVIAQQSLVALNKLPPSAPVTVAIVVFGILVTAIPLIQAILTQQNQHALMLENQAHAHALQLAQIRGPVA